MTESNNKTIQNRFLVPTQTDLEESSKAWHRNKRYLGNGQFAYICQYIHSNGKRCTHIIEKHKSKQQRAQSTMYAWQCENVCLDESEIE